jgi:hypothetical protein
VRSNTNARKPYHGANRGRSRPDRVGSLLLKWGLMSALVKGFGCRPLEDNMFGGRRPTAADVRPNCRNDYNNRRDLLTFQLDIGRRTEATHLPLMPAPSCDCRRAAHSRMISKGRSRSRKSSSSQ